jgi:hypothetical protein
MKGFRKGSQLSSVGGGEGAGPTPVETRRVPIDHSRLGDDGFLGRRPKSSPNLFNRIDHIVSGLDRPKHDVLTVEMRRDRGGDEELRGLRVRPGVGHREQMLLGVAQTKVLVVEGPAVDGLASVSIAVGEVASLYHEPRNHTVETRTLIVKRFATLANAFLAGAECPEILSSERDDVCKELKCDAACGSMIEVDVKEDEWIGLRMSLGNADVFRRRHRRSLHRQVVRMVYHPLWLRGHVLV